MEDVKKRRRIFLSPSILERCLEEINSREIRLHLTFSANWITEGFYSRGQLLCKFIGTKVYVGKRKQFFPQDWFGILTWPLFHCFGTQYGRRDVM